MALIELPVSPGVIDQSFSLRLDGAVYSVRLRFNTRAGFWALDLGAADGAELLAGLAVRLGVDLLAPYADDRFPPGRLFAVNYVADYAEPDRDSLGRDVAIVYEES